MILYLTPPNKTLKGICCARPSADTVSDDAIINTSRNKHVKWYYENWKKNNNIHQRWCVIGDRSSVCRLASYFPEIRGGKSSSNDRCKRNFFFLIHIFFIFFFVFSARWSLFDRVHLSATADRVRQSNSLPIEGVCVIERERQRRKTAHTFRIWGGPVLGNAAKRFRVRTGHVHTLI